MFVKKNAKFLSVLLGLLLLLPILPAGTSSAATTNVASGITPTCSGAIDNASRTTDGDINTANYCSVTTGVTWIMLDFGASYDINKVNLWHYYGDGRTFHDVIVQLSNTSNFSTKTTVFNNDANNSAGQGTGTDSEYAETSNGKEITFTTVNARYMRLYTNGSTANNYGYYVEVQAWTSDGEPTPTPTVTSSPTPTPTIQGIYEDFEDNIADGFTVDTGTYTIITDGTKVYNTTSSAARSVVGDSSLSDLSAESKVKVTSWSASTGRTAGLLGRFSNSNNYYLFIWEDNNLIIKRKVNGALTTLASKAYTLSLNTWYIFKAEMEGTLLDFYVNGTKELSASDISLSSGKIGFISFNGNVSYDDFYAGYAIVPTPTSSPTPTPTPTPTTTATTPPEGTDLFGVTKMYDTKSGGREWYSNWIQNMAKQWCGTCPFDPMVDFNNGSQYVEIATNSGDKELIISSTDPDNNYPRIYIGNAATENFWDNVEVTFYCKAVSLSSNICGWGGLEAVIKTTHYPDGYNNNAENDNCRGYGGRITYDGDSDIEKEMCHSPNRNARTSPIYPWGDGVYMPLNQWIGYKFIGTTCNNGTKVHLKLYIDTVSNGNLANQQWTLLKDITDEDNITSIWPSGQSNTAASSYRTGSPYVGKALCGSNKTTQKWVYIRTDGVREQRYKYMSVREINPEP